MRITSQRVVEMKQSHRVQSKHRTKNQMATAQRSTRGVDRDPDRAREMAEDRTNLKTTAVRDREADRGREIDDAIQNDSTRIEIEIEIEMIIEIVNEVIETEIEIEMIIGIVKKMIEIEIGVGIEAIEATETETGIEIEVRETPIEIERETMTERAKSFLTSPLSATSTMALSLV